MSIAVITTGSSKMLSENKYLFVRTYNFTIHS